MIRFVDQTQVARDATVPGRYLAEVTGDWNAPLLPQGGIVTALGLRAMAAELALPDQRLRSVSVAFAGPVGPGPVEIDVAVLRRGRSLSQATATVRPEGADAGHTAIAVFGATRQGFEFTDLAAPEAGPPEQAESWLDERNPYRLGSDSFWDNAEYRLASGHFPWTTRWEPESAERLLWLRFHETPRLDDGTVDPLAVVALCDVMPGAIVERIGPDCPPFFAPSADLTVHVLAAARSDWFLARNHCRFAGDGYASLELELWDPAHGLVAYATQVAFLKILEGAPSQARL